MTQSEIQTLGGRYLKIGDKPRGQDQKTLQKSAGETIDGGRFESPIYPQRRRDADHLESPVYLLDVETF